MHLILINNNQLCLEREFICCNSVICKIPLANKVPDNNAAGILNLSKKKIKMIEDIINKIK